ncbi:hypothetical protein BT96DRAFT_950338 [Gymnopus androsaceus JB14]|uniref:Uncharacterized protein n=1 Tax=Gymnopus androsaceus JB14 TaxID=1447944 RepID=A0A6A4GHA8_9AGAR|nr:hypothetical protein BT96DRAFT_950338 [Gymnopus androsaceus JB14]
MWIPHLALRQEEQLPLTGPHPAKVVKEIKLHTLEGNRIATMKSLADEVELSMVKFGLSEYLPIQSALNEDIELREQGRINENEMDTNGLEPIPISRILDQSLCHEKNQVAFQSSASSETLLDQFLIIEQTNERMWISHTDGKEW